MFSSFDFKLPMHRLFCTFVDTLFCREVKRLLSAGSISYTVKLRKRKLAKLLGISRRGVGGGGERIVVRLLGKKFAFEKLKLSVWFLFERVCLLVCYATCRPSDCLWLLWLYVFLLC